MAEYSAKQEQGHTDVGMSGAEKPAIPVISNAPDSQGTTGPPAQSQFPWPGRAEAAYAAEYSSADAYAAILTQAQNSPGTVVSTAATAGVPNSGAGTHGDMGSMPDMPAMPMPDMGSMEH